jgi:hypothetical protein
MDKKELFAHLLDLKSCAVRGHKDEFRRLALIIMVPKNETLKKAYCHTREHGYMLSSNLDPEKQKQAEETEKLIDLGFECFRSDNFKPLLDLLPTRNSPGR